MKYFVYFFFLINFFLVVSYSGFFCTDSKKEAISLTYIDVCMYRQGIIRSVDQE